VIPPPQRRSGQRQRVERQVEARRSFTHFSSAAISFSEGADGSSDEETSSSLCVIVVVVVVGLVVVGVVVDGASATAKAKAVGARIVVAHIGGVHDDLAVDIAIGAATITNPVLVIKCAHHATDAGESSADESDEASSGNDGSGSRNDGMLLFDAQRRFLKRTMAGTHIDVLFRANEDDVAKEVFSAMEQPIAPAVLLLGFSSPLLEMFAEKREGWRTSIACANSPLAPSMGIARSNTIHTLHTTHAQQQSQSKSPSLASLFMAPTDEEIELEAERVARTRSASHETSEVESSMQSAVATESGDDSEHAAGAHHHHHHHQQQGGKRRRARRRNE
jgi:hypothetical protein